ncbi:MAG TPA: DUF4339 domain-containing protein [Candidatus Sumerlaeota bacterium]|jgi:hypothetical protein|nr:MAG: hypothetical protein BWY12_00519 [candidate division BRC1 bacterium ADurb.Bin183]HOE63129.1 DUF4339 domain-containing protein [Candidatus Sumerlaeota bacterium]HRR31136.1 DUF4339 domain-containing protein [Candidatus Sumerlaeia bacterium]HON51556.1 DUF4339 domain-containing protein [Candidatus Sumerlaeota bacterium]HOR65282.1 DUF4339 domain-containing protein [Candidatus Sumerlaeota bacterium]
MIDDKNINPETIDKAEKEASMWFYEKNGQRLGPISGKEIEIMLMNKELNNESFVWKEGMSDWVKIEYTELKCHFSGPPPLTGDAVNNTYIWILAFAPIIGEILESIFGFFVGIIAGIINSPAPLGFLAFSWVITVVLNIVLATIDEKKLKIAGHDTSKMGQAWLVPVYMFKRAKVLKQNLAYFIVWCVCFGLIILWI